MPFTVGHQIGGLLEERTRCDGVIGNTKSVTHLFELIRGEMVYNNVGQRPAKGRFIVWQIFYLLIPIAQGGFYLLDGVSSVSNVMLDRRRSVSLTEQRLAAEQHGQSLSMRGEQLLLVCDIFWSRHGSILLLEG
jgi:hypothetical protein